MSIIIYRQLQPINIGGRAMRVLQAQVDFATVVFFSKSKPFYCRICLLLSISTKNILVLRNPVSKTILAKKNTSYTKFLFCALIRNLEEIKLVRSNCRFVRIFGLC